MKIYLLILPFTGKLQGGFSLFLDLDAHLAYLSHSAYSFKPYYMLYIEWDTNLRHVPQSLIFPPHSQFIHSHSDLLDEMPIQSFFCTTRHVHSRK